MQKPFLIATANLGKFKEIFHRLEPLEFRFLSLLDLPDAPSQVEETGGTYEHNARLKARHFFDVTGWMTLGEDSGIEVEALQGELGLFTRRFGVGVEASDEVWLEHFLERMSGVPDGARAARFVCTVVLILSSGEEHVFFGETQGTITRKPEAPLLPGLPLSSVFKPEGCSAVYAALSSTQKADISHRGLAVGGVRDFLIQFPLR